MTTAYIDGDVLKYRSAYAAELPQWGCFEPDGECYAVAEDKRKAQNLIDNSVYLKDCVVKRTAEELPFSVAIQHFNNDLRDIMKGTGADKYVIYLSDQDDSKNYRYKKATTHPYKGNRVLDHVPFHKTSMYHHIQKVGGEVVDQGEADDALGWSVYNDPDGICVSIDKDLLMVPGKHYNITSGEIMVASDPGELTLTTLKYGKKLTGHGFKWFCAQMLMGDNVDNIKGLSRYGDVKAHKVLDSVKGIEELWTMVKNHYFIAGENPERVGENADLLWIQRNFGELFDDWWRDYERVL